MGRRSNAAIAAEQASEAARILQAKGQEAKQAKVEPEAPAEPASEYQNDAVSKLPRGNVHQVKVREQIREARGEPKNEIPEKSPEKAPEKPAEASVEPAATEPTPEQPAPVETPVEAPKTVKVKVDGEEMEVPEAEVEEAGGVKSYQIQKAAEKRLKEANATLASAKETEAQVKAMQQLVANLVQQNKPVEQTDAQFIASKVDVIRFGTPEESAAALAEVMGRNQPKIDPNMIVEQATERMKHDTAVAAFDREFQDISTNPMLVKLAASLRNEKINQARQRNERIPDWGAFYRGIGNEIRGALPRQNQSPAPANVNGTTSQVTDKEARKASISEPPKAAAVRAQAPAEPKEETREDSIRRMRKARGLPVE